MSMTDPAYQVVEDPAQGAESSEPGNTGKT
jgi:hypothetical protein